MTIRRWNNALGHFFYIAIGLQLFVFCCSIHSSFGMEGMEGIESDQKKLKPNSSEDHGEIIVKDEAEDKNKFFMNFPQDLKICIALALKKSMEEDFYHLSPITILMPDHPVNILSLVSREWDRVMKKIKNIDGHPLNRPVTLPKSFLSHLLIYAPEGSNHENTQKTLSFEKLLENNGNLKLEALYPELNRQFKITYNLTNFYNERWDFTMILLSTLGMIRKEKKYGLSTLVKSWEEKWGDTLNNADIVIFFRDGNKILTNNNYYDALVIHEGYILGLNSNQNIRGQSFYNLAQYASSLSLSFLHPPLEYCSCTNEECRRVTSLWKYLFLSLFM